MTELALHMQLSFQLNVFYTACAYFTTITCCHKRFLVNWIGCIHSTKNQSRVTVLVIHLRCVQTEASTQNVASLADCIFFIPSDHVRCLLHQVPDTV